MKELKSPSMAAIARVVAFAFDAALQEPKAATAAATKASALMTAITRSTADTVALKASTSLADRRWLRSSQGPRPPSALVLSFG